MAGPSLRLIAKELGLSASTVSRALHQDPRVKPATARRVMDALRDRGYQLNPTVSAALSMVRRRSFYRETLAWCTDRPIRDMPWVKEVHVAAREFAGQLGYRIEYFHFGQPGERKLTRLTSVWRARGIRGVLLGPFRGSPKELPFVWDGFAWVLVGHAYQHPFHHTVGRDYRADIDQGLAWLKQQGCRRPGFIVKRESETFLHDPLLRGALRFYYDSDERMEKPLLELDACTARTARDWWRRNRPDSVVISSAGHRANPLVRSLLRGLPSVILSEDDDPRPGSIVFSPRFTQVGQSSVNVMDRLLRMQQFGMPAYKHSVLLASRSDVF